MPLADLFVFYRSFRDAIREMDEHEQLETLLALCDYALDGIEPDLPTPMQRAVLTIAKPLIDASNKSREAGKRGGRPSNKDSAKTTQKTTVKTPVYNPCENPHQNQQEQEQEVKTRSKNKNAADAALENAAAAPAEDPRLDTALAQIVRRYEEDIGSFPRSALQPLQRWRRTLGDELIGLAIGEAAENNARSWRYVDRVLSSWEKEGVRTAGDVQVRKERKAAPASPAPQYERLT